MNSKIRLLFGFGLISLSSASLLAAEVTKDLDYTMDANNRIIEIHNLAGNITVTPSNDADIQINGVVIANDKSKSNAEELASEIQFKLTKKGKRDILTLTYPVNDYDGFIYNPDKKGGNYYTSSEYMGKKVRIAKRAKGFGKEWANVYTNLDIKLPTDQASKVKVIAGGINAENFNNPLTLDTGSGKVYVKNAKGNLLADTGSGRITVERFEGDVTADSGSGRVSINNVSGDVSADTGSGRILIDTVTGNVNADTGSGRTEILNFQGGELIKVDTGSGSVRVDGDLSKVKDLEIDTGSGSVKLITNKVPSLDIEIDTGSGGINVDLPNLDVRKDKRGDFQGTVGSGKGEANIDTGSGSVSFEMDDSYVPSDEVTNQVAEPNTEESIDLAENPKLAARVRKAINKDSDLRKANLDITAFGNKVYIEGSVDNLWDIAKTVKIANNVDGVDGVSIDFE